MQLRLSVLVDILHIPDPQPRDHPSADRGPDICFRILSLVHFGGNCETDLLSVLVPQISLLPAERLNAVFYFGAAVRKLLRCHVLSVQNSLLCINKLKSDPGAAHKRRERSTQNDRNGGNRRYALPSFSAGSAALFFVLCDSGIDLLQLCAQGSHVLDTFFPVQLQALHQCPFRLRQDIGAL